MNSNEIRGKFNEIKGDFKKKWGELTDDDWKQIGGSKDKLVGVLQQKYGRTKDQAQHEVDDFWKENQERKVS
ncbi:MAG: general stress protein CsbD [Acidobacteria bacterium]|nr:MAG: general stress protein CsbD [Acidobacteriota bacterium]